MAVATCFRAVPAVVSMSAEGQVSPTCAVVGRRPVRASEPNVVSSKMAAVTWWTAVDAPRRRRAVLLAWQMSVVANPSVVMSLGPNAVSSVMAAAPPSHAGIVPTMKFAVETARIDVAKLRASRRHAMSSGSSAVWQQTGAEILWIAARVACLKGAVEVASPTNAGVSCGLAKPSGPCAVKSTMAAAVRWSAVSAARPTNADCSSPTGVLVQAIETDTARGEDSRSMDSQGTETAKTGSC